MKNNGTDLAVIARYETGVKISVGGKSMATSRIKNMTEGKPLSLIFTFALPLMIGNVFQQLYTVIDTMVVGRALGVSALAALGATDWLNWLFSGLVQGFAQGFSILMAQEFGSGNYKRLRKVIFNSLILFINTSISNGFTI